MTSPDAVFDDGTLTINRANSEDALVLRLAGKCIIRDANDTLLPVFVRALEEAAEARRRLVLDFSAVSYMNSSSFAPVIKILEKARLGQQALTIHYDAAEKWQSVSFSAMTIFKTPDQRIQINGSAA